MAFEIITQPEWVAVVRTGGLNWPGEWVRNDRLVPVFYTYGQSSLGTARFRMLPRKVTANGQSIQAEELVNGAYVGISKAGDELNPVWFGFISAMPELRFQANDDRIGVVEAREIGNLFDQIKLTNWMTVYGDQETQQRTDDPPQANYEIAAGELIGNKIEVEIDGEDRVVFAGSPEDCTKDDANYWTRDDLLTHINNFALPADFVQIAMNVSAEALVELGAVYKENFLFRNATLRTALDVLVSRDRGYTWRVRLVDDVWIIDIGLTFDEAEKFDIDLTQLNQRTLRELSIDDDAGTQVDEVVVQGLPIVFMCSFENGKADPNSTPLYFRKGWSDTAEGNYELATAEERKNAEFADVFQRYEFFDPNNDGTLLAQIDASGIGNPVGVCPQIDIPPLFGTPFADFEKQRTPYFATARLNRVLPWANGYGKGSDTRDAQQKSQPTYSASMVFTRDDLDNFTDLTKAWPEEFQQQSIDTGPDDRQLGIRITCPYNHVLGLNTIIDEDGEVAIFDYRNLAFTVAFESSQLYSASQRRAGVTQVRKQLIIRGDWQLWCCHEGTIIGVDDNRDAIRAVKTGPYSVNQNMGEGIFALRDDTKELLQALTEATLWAFRESRSGAIVLTDTGFEASWAVPGASIGMITDRVATSAEVDIFGGPEESRFVEYTVNAIVESVTINCDAQDPDNAGMTINFGARNLLGTNGQSKTIITNPSQALSVNDLPRQIKHLTASVQSMPTTFGKGGGGGDSPAIIQVLDGNVLTPAANSGIEFFTGTQALVIDDPDVAGDTRADGLGRGLNIVSGQNIMLVHDTSAPYGIQAALRAGDFGIIVSQRSVTVGPATTIYYYIARF